MTFCDLDGTSAFYIIARAAFFGMLATTRRDSVTTVHCTCCVDSFTLGVHLGLASFIVVLNATMCSKA